MHINTPCLVIGQNLKAAIQAADGSSVQLDKRRETDTCRLTAACEVIKKINPKGIILIRDPKNPEPLKGFCDFSDIQPEQIFESGQPIIVENFHHVMFMEICENPTTQNLGGFIFLERDLFTGKEWFVHFVFANWR